MQIDDSFSDLDTTFDSGQAVEGQSTVETTVSVPKGPSIDDAIAEAVAKQTGERPRDEAGRFANNKPVEIAPPADQKSIAPVVDPNAPIAPVVSQPPASWGAKNADLWGKLPPDAQAFLQQREDQITRGFQRYEGVAQYADMAEQSGTTLKDALSRYVQYEKSMETNPVQTLLNLAALYQVKPQQIMAALGSAGQQPTDGQRPAPIAQIDPRIAQTIQSLQSQVEEMRVAPIKQTVAQFFDDPANKYADQVADTIALILNANPNVDLKSAYDQACWSDPAVRAEMLKEQQAEWAKTNTTAKAAQPPMAARSLQPSPVQRTPNAPRKGMSIEEAIEDAIRRQS